MERANEGNGLGLWIPAIALAGLATWVMFDALPGINWGIWTGLSAFGLLAVAKPRASKVLPFLAATATIIALGSAITSAELISFLSVLSVIMLLALEMLLAPNPTFKRITPTFAVPAPIVAFVTAIAEAIRRAAAALNLVRSDRARAVVRGLLITVPVILIFALLLSNADPTFAGWREAIARLIQDWSFVPRTIFFIGALTLVLGAFGYAMRTQTAAPEAAPAENRKWIGATERLILFTSVAVLFWIFLGVQLSYLFGNLPEVAGSGVTFADYARRGFAELTVVASATVVLILLSERFGESGGRRKAILTATLAVVVAVLLLLGSAFNRVLLYEEAYGFTTARLYAQVFMLLVGFALLTLAWEMRDNLDTSRFFRRVAFAATAAFIVLIYWNHEAWIAAKNIDRSAATGKLDVAYLTRDLSPDAIPTIVERMPRIAEPYRSEVQRSLATTYARRRRMFETDWYEWNYRRMEARRALESIGAVTTAPTR